MRRHASTHSLSVQRFNASARRFSSASARRVRSLYSCIGGGEVAVVAVVERLGFGLAAYRVKRAVKKGPRILIRGPA